MAYNASMETDVNNYRQSIFIGTAQRYSCLSGAYINKGHLVLDLQK